MKSSYDEALRRLLLHEGGYTNHPSDPGGPTNFGITLADYRMYVKPGATAADVRAMWLDEAKTIYKAKYWDATRCDELEPGVDYAVFDYAVNSGVGRAGRVLRRILKMPDDTSVMTDGVVRASRAMKAADLAKAICDERIAFLKRLSTWPVFGPGWGRRVTEVRAYSAAIADDLPDIPSPPTAPAGHLAMEPDKASRVKALQADLAARGFDPGAIDGDLGPKTVKAFQRANGLKVDGVVGVVTRPLLDAALAAALQTAGKV